MPVGYSGIAFPFPVLIEDDFVALSGQTAKRGLDVYLYREGENGELW